jgi:hypothetical protein
MSEVILQYKDCESFLDKLALEYRDDDNYPRGTYVKYINEHIKEYGYIDAEMRFHMKDKEHAIMFILKFS